MKEENMDWVLIVGKTIPQFFQIKIKKDDFHVIFMCA